MCDHGRDGREPVEGEDKDEEAAEGGELPRQRGQVIVVDVQGL